MTGIERLAWPEATDYDRCMPMILLYFFLAFVVVGGVMLATPDNDPPPPSPRDVMMQLKQNQ